jgi:polyhydroxyalkanoate synthesis repressor PhaR
MDSIRVIKRYANRKLYDLNESRYVTLEEIAKFIRKGEEVKVIDNNSNEDLTSLTMTQILFEQEKRNRRLLPLSTLKTMIRSGEKFFQKKIASPVSTLKDEAEKTMLKLREDAEKTLQKMVNLNKLDDMKSLAKYFVDASELFMGEIQKQFDERLKIVMDILPNDASWKRDLDSLKDLLLDLDRRIRFIEQHEGIAAPPADHAADKDDDID